MSAIRRYRVTVDASRDRYYIRDTMTGRTWGGFPTADAAFETARRANRARTIAERGTPVR